ncbi:T9SS type A sorting domain-containing protein [Chryseobacterium sp. KACC 21268]|nr:T9SS type A sorting domain-containing protein [Chryseobacterium sp. KACC 21268]
MQKFLLFSLAVISQFVSSQTMKTAYFKPPSTWTSACVWPNVIDPPTLVDFFSPPPMASTCEGWYKYSTPFNTAEFVFNNCKYIAGAPPHPDYLSVSVTTADTIFYDYSAGPISNPPACLLAVNESAKNMVVVKIFPNPVQDFVNIESDKNFVAYEIIEESGKLLLNKDFKGSKIDISNLKTGVYFIKLKSLSNETNIVKFIKK